MVKGQETAWKASKLGDILVKPQAKEK